MLTCYITDRTQFPGSEAERQERLLRTIAGACSAGVDALSILLSGGDAAKGAFNLADQADYRLVVYRSQSLLRRLLAAADATCG